MSRPPVEGKTSRPKKRQEPWLPSEYDPADIGAIKALASGTANPDQQRRALDFIIVKLALTYDEPFYPGGQEGERLTSYALGKRFVGQQIIKMTKLTTPARLSTDTR